MATAQGIVRISGTPTPSVYYTAVFHRPAVITQWRRVVRLTDNTGLYQVAISEDNFMGTNFVAQNGDKLAVLFWRRTGSAPAKAPGEAYENQSPTTGLGGDHEIGCKHNNGASAVSNYAGAELFAVVVFDVSGNDWNATPGGGGIGDVDGDVSLQTNLGPSAVLAGLSTNPATPTDIQRLVSQLLNNTSADNQNLVSIPGRVTGQIYSQFGQILLQQISAAHRPATAPQSADGSPIDGSRYQLFNGQVYNNTFGVIVPGPGGTPDGPSQVHYQGPSFVSHNHTWPRIDVYRVRLTSKDDSGFLDGELLNPPLTAQADFYVRTTYRPPGVAFGSREWAAWTALVAASGNPAFSPANPNTIRDVVRIAVDLNGADNPIQGVAQYSLGAAANAIFAINGKIVVRGDPWSSEGIYSVLTADINLGAAVANQLTINQPGIGTGIQAGNLAPGEIPGFINLITRTPLLPSVGLASPILHSYRIISAPNANSIIIDTEGSTLVYSSKDWFFISNEPGGGNRVRWDWEVEQGLPTIPWVGVGKPYQQLGGSPLGPGATLVKTNIGEGVWPGMFLHVLNGSMRGWYQIAEVPDDNTIVLAPGDALPGQIAAADTIAIGFPSKPIKFPQRKNDALNFRISYQFTNGWSQTPGQPWVLDRNPAPALLTNSGAVDNIDPEAVIPTPAAVSGAAVTYVFNGSRSYGTQVNWVQGDPLGTDPGFANGGTIGVGTAISFTDFNLNNVGLRDNGHAVLILTNTNGEILHAFRIVDINHASPTNITIDTTSLGAPFNYSAGQTFRTANDYETEPGGTPNDIASYAWELRSRTTPLPPLGVNDPAFPTWWALARFDGADTGPGFSHTYPIGDNNRIAVIALTVVDEDTPPGGNAPGTSTKYLPFVVDVTGGPSPTGFGPRRMEWD